MSQLRKALGGSGSGPISTRPPGYLIQVRAGELDAEEFAALTAEARARASAAEVEDASALFAEALALWRGRPLAGIELESVGRHELERLEEQHVVALMDRIDCDLVLGRHEHLVGELEVLVAEHPLRERLWAQQMVALYRSGRQADALRAYQRARTVLVDELGLEPSPALQRLERGILNHDPSLQSSAGTARRDGPEPVRPVKPPETPPAAGSRASWRRRRLLAAALTGAAVLAAGGLAAMLIRGSAPESALAAEGNPILLVDPGSARAADQIALPRRPLVAAGDGRTLWVGGADGMLTRISGAVSSTVETPNVGGSIGGLAIGNGSVWATDQQRRKVVRFDPSAWKVVDRIPVGNGAQAVAFACGSAWVANRTDATIYRVDPSRDKVTAHIPIGISPAALAFGAGSFWVANDQLGVVWRIDPRTKLPVARRRSTSVQCRCRWPTATAPCGSGTPRTGSGGSTRAPTAPPRRRSARASTRWRSPAGRCGRETPRRARWRASTCRAAASCRCRDSAAHRSRSATWAPGRSSR